MLKASLFASPARFSSKTKPNFRSKRIVSAKSVLLKWRVFWDKLWINAMQMFHRLRNFFIRHFARTSNAIANFWSPVHHRNVPANTMWFEIMWNTSSGKPWSSVRSRNMRMKSPIPAENRTVGMRCASRRRSNSSPRSRRRILDVATNSRNESFVRPAKLNLYVRRDSYYALYARWASLKSPRTIG